MKVLYIAGWGRSGSTLLQRILGQIDGFVAVGETFYFWQHGLIENRRCGCGAAFRDCPRWTAVLARAFGGPGGVDAPAMQRAQSELVRHRHLPRLMRPAARRAPSPREAAYLAHLERLYGAIAATTGARVVVETSKLAAFGFVVGLLPSVDLHVVHLVRDARAVALSWQRRTETFDRMERHYLPQHGPARSAALWAAQNVAAHLVWHRSARYRLLRYEDFVARPRAAIAGILDLLGEHAAALPFTDDHRVALGVDHTVQGNPNRFQVGEVDIRAEAWERGMARWRYLLVTALTWPLLARYGYLRPGPP